MDYEEENRFKDMVRSYVAKRVGELLHETAFSVQELTAVISHELTSTIKRGVSEQAETGLIAGQLSHDRQGRLRRVD